MFVWAVIFIVVLLRTKMEMKAKRMGMIMAVAILVIAQLFNTIMIKATNATPGSINEALSIPSAQIARCYAFKNDVRRC